MSGCNRVKPKLRLAPRLLADARRRAGLTQAELAKRLTISQAAVAQLLERADSNPRLATLDRALRAAGAELVLTTRPRRHAVDEGLTADSSNWAPTERLRGLEAMYEQARSSHPPARCTVASWPDFRPTALIGALVQADVDFVIDGGVAVVVQASPRFTRDLDISYSTDTANLQRLGALSRPR